MSGLDISLDGEHKSLCSTISINNKNEQEQALNSIYWEMWRSSGDSDQFANLYLGVYVCVQVCMGAHMSTGTCTLGCMFYRGLGFSSFILIGNYCEPCLKDSLSW